WRKLTNEVGRYRSAVTPRCKLAGQHRHHWIMAQLVVVVEVLVAERNSEHPLAYQRDDLMLDQLLAPRVVKTGGEPIHLPDRTIRRSNRSAPASDVIAAASNARPPRVLPHVQIQRDLDYTLSAIGTLRESWQAAVSRWA